ncbi:MAG: AAA family ATPase, partial [Gemmataceae bacterium]
ERLGDHQAVIVNELEWVQTELRKAQSAWEIAQQQATDADEDAEKLRLRLEQTAQDLTIAMQTRETRQAEQAAAQLALAQGQQQRQNLAQRVQEREAELRQRKIDALNLATAERNSRTRQTATMLSILRASQQSAHAYSEADERLAKRNQLGQESITLKAQREQALALVTDGRAQREEWGQELHTLALRLRELHTERAALVRQMQDEYAVNLAASDPFEPPDSTESMEELRQKLARLGSVNLEAVEQLAAEEQREKSYRGQYDDLRAAEGSLLEIIEQIQTDSRRLFQALFETTRGHFQELFRKLFGGGRAEIVLENPADVLESGIEISVKPPGKELRSITLLSGGEKTLTAVALLLALFRSQPSPFCLLDEVDAALDEANAVRLANLLQEFENTTQFIVITHKKRTMAVANTLHGITMQESGVSKRIELRFEDWPEDQASAAAA